MDYLTCSLRNLKLAGIKNFKVDLNDNTWFFIVEPGPETMQVVQSYGYANFVGGQDLSILTTNPMGFTVLEETLHDEQKRSAVLHNFYNMNQMLVNALWFVKDNSVTPNSATISSSELIDPSSLRRNIVYSSSEASYLVSEFNKEELEEAMKWIKIIDSYAQKVKASDINIKSQGLQNISNYVRFDVSSFQRAFYLLDSARKSDFLPAKIALYISVLETLLAVKGENTYKTSIRAAAVIGETKELKYEIFLKVKKAYDIRSAYVHGSHINDKSHRKLSDICKETDHIVRRVFKEMLIEHTDLNYTSNDTQVNRKLDMMSLQ